MNEYTNTTKNQHTPLLLLYTTTSVKETQQLSGTRAIFGSLTPTMTNDTSHDRYRTFRLVWSGTGWFDMTLATRTTPRADSTPYLVQVSRLQSRIRLNRIDSVYLLPRRSICQEFHSNHRT